MVHHLTEGRIKDWAGLRVFQRGKAYYREGRVREVRVFVTNEMGLWQAEALVVGQTGIYDVFVEWDARRGHLDGECTCPYSWEDRVCKHMVAVALELRDVMETDWDSKTSGPSAEESLQAWETNLKQVVRRLRRATPKDATPYVLAFALSSFPSYPIARDGEMWVVPLYVPWKEGAPSGPEHFPKDPERWQFPKQRLRPELCVNLPPEAVEAANLFLTIQGLVQSRFFFMTNASTKTLNGLLDEAWALLLRAASQADVHLLAGAGDEMIPLPLRVPQAVDLDVGLRIHQKDKKSVLEPALRVRDRVYGLLDIPWLPLVRGYMLPLEEEVVPVVQEPWISRVETLMDLPPLPLTEATQERLASTFAPLLSMLPVWLGEKPVSALEGLRTPPEPRLYIKEDPEKGLVAELRFGYGPVEFPYQGQKARPVEIVPRGTEPRFWRVFRDVEQEREWRRKAASATFGLKRGPGALLLLRARVHPVDFLLDKVPKLAQAGFVIFGAKELIRKKVQTTQPVLRLEASSGIDWFDLKGELAFGDQTVGLREALRALKRGERFVKLADGTLGVLPEDLLERLRSLLDLSRWHEGERLRLDKTQAALLEELLEAVQGLDYVRVDVRDEEIRRVREQLKKLEDVRELPPVPLPQGLRVQLRPYQVQGYRWLHFLYQNGFGGILADDMGLGKTVQTLAFLLSLREQGLAQGPNLVVAPRSLLFNWQREIERFTPGLKVLVYAGPKRPPLDALDAYDVVLTTYGLVRQNVARLQQKSFHVLVLDEAQAIKNPLTKTARALRRLQARHRIALTGTPVENTTLELWSIFAVVMPGLLGSLEAFKRVFAVPIEQEGDQEAAARLRRLVGPFLLRRTKEQVAPELPPRTERVLYATMTPEQAEMYHQVREAFRAKLLGLLEADDQDDGHWRMHVLEGLLRLRQLALHPVLVDPAYRGGSGKMELLFTLLESLQEGGHKALVYSQFVNMLRLVREDMDRRGWRYAYLDGSTRDRQAQVDRFQQDPTVPFFLISLRAGGVGLNLTAAEYVLLLDPWWNPAVERQAADRTHRIGQEKPVFLFKLITQGTVEEKILQLQQRKQKLVEQIVTPTDTAWLRALRREDIEALFGDEAG